ncbi:Krr1-domain-containing protein [Hyphopichia burtonii NRRL Y-1933]|uniref:Krr1-domain-containing protein n=1 Tax=Hyphopichia burtonii NRRL Y-1933 TaxID=984485 RepID=A0A1E4RQT7_9ASCO|nr:Krr1-domain-containing protein [Hyphopichia burtonii NRRL Y-1933]ODV69640.1 Krr1-domain-containing protein [Hyphopichia burtonii NRRL Y-1933]
MARKKSAAKRAREEALKAEVASAPAIEEKQEVEKPTKEKSTKETQEVSDDDDEDLESSEEEDEYGQLITDNVETGINKVLEALKNDPKKLLDPNLKFFDDPEKNSALKEKINKEKPMYLKDYHRQNLLSGDFKHEDDENEYGTVDGEKPFVVTEREERNQLLSDIKSAFNDDEDDDGSDDDFLKKKESKKDDIEKPKTVLPDPEKNQEAFLNAFLDNQAWIPKKNDKVLDLDKIDNDDEEDFDNAVEDFEKAYNFRYEDPNAAEIVSYARNQATLRRSNTNSRKRQRDKKIELKEKENQEKEELLKKKKTQKMNKVLDRLTKIKEAVGEEVSDETIQKVFGNSLLDEDFDDADWDSKMAQIFDEQYYGNEDSKPEWGEDDEIMGDFHKENKEDSDQAEDEEQSQEDLDGEPPKKKSKKEKLKEKKSSKKEKQSLKEKAQQIVESNAVKILDEVEDERGRSQDKEEVRFKYRDVSPETFGLSTRDIILADDKQLNSFIGIKKFAPYRSKEQALKDKRKYAKKKHLQDWRKEVFHDKNGPRFQDGEKENEIWIPIENEETSKSTKKTKKRKNKH